MNKKYTTNNFSETQILGQNFAREVLSAKSQKSAAVLALRGDLGAGKTTFLQGFAKGLGIKEVVNSPTFVILKRFKIRCRSEALTKSKASLRQQYKFFYHLDLYRLENKNDLEFLYLQEIFSNPENIIAIEWPEKLGELLPKNTISINFEHLEENERGLTISR